MKLKLADFCINYNGTNYVLEVKAADYMSDFEKSDMDITLSKQEIEDEIILCNKKVPPMRAENNLIYQSVAEWLPFHNAFVLHAATFDVDGVGVAFTAHSGTGKTTHMKLWQEYLENRMIVVNGDKPIVRFFDDNPEIPYAYGTPWNGKERYGCNMRTPLRHLCFIKRSETNYVKPMDKNNAINLILNQVYMPQKSPVALSNTIQLINRLLNSCNLWEIYCNTDSDAAKTTYNAIFGNE